MNHILENIKNILNYEDYDVDKIIETKYERVCELLRDSDELSEENLPKVIKIKKAVIESEALNLSDENVLGDIELILKNIPNVSPIEKVRWLYIKLGHLFSYDYRVVNNPEYGRDKIVDFNTYVGRYETCVQVSSILNEILNSIEGVESKIIERQLGNVRGAYGENHVANEVKIKRDDIYETYLLDLTLDLYLIQAGCKTNHFGFESGPMGQYDIIPQIDNYEMDTNLNLLKNGDYTNSKINEIKVLLKELEQNNLSPKELVDKKILMINYLAKTFPGYHEGKQYVNLLFKELLNMSYKEFNMHSKRDSNVNLKTCYLIEYEDYQKWLIYSNRLGFMSTDSIGLRDMLDDGWITKSETLENEINKTKRYTK